MVKIYWVWLEKYWNVCRASSSIISPLTDLFYVPDHSPFFIAFQVSLHIACASQLAQADLWCSLSMNFKGYISGERRTSIVCAIYQALPYWVLHKNLFYHLIETIFLNFDCPMFGCGCRLFLFTIFVVHTQNFVDILSAEGGHYSNVCSATNFCT